MLWRLDGDTLLPWIPCGAASGLFFRRRPAQTEAIWILNAPNQAGSWRGRSRLSAVDCHTVVRILPTITCVPYSKVRRGIVSRQALATANVCRNSTILSQPSIHGPRHWHACPPRSKHRLCRLPQDRINTEILHRTQPVSRTPQQASSKERGCRTEGMAAWPLKRLRTLLSIPLGFLQEASTHLYMSLWWL